MIRRRAAHLAAGLLAAGAIGAGLFVYPAWRAARGVRRDIASAHRRIGQIVDRPAQLARRQEAIAALARFEAEHTKPLPPQSDVAGLIRGLSVYLDELAIPSREVATGAPVRTGAITVMPMTLTMRCDFLSACAVVARIESLPRLIRVRRFRLAHDAGDTGAPDRSAPLKAEVLLEVLSMDAPPPTGEKMASPEKGAEP